MKLIVTVQMKGTSQEPRLAQFILETPQEMERFANFYAKTNPTIAALLDVLLGKQEQKPEDTQVIQIGEGEAKTN